LASDAPGSPMIHANPGSDKIYPGPGRRNWQTPWTQGPASAFCSTKPRRKTRPQTLHSCGSQCAASFARSARVDFLRGGYKPDGELLSIRLYRGWVAYHGTTLSQVPACNHGGGQPTRSAAASLQSRTTRFCTTLPCWALRVRSDFSTVAVLCAGKLICFVKSLATK
jgi:hypothetical protein